MINYLILFIVWLIGFSMSMYFCDKLMQFNGKLKRLYILFSLLSWVTICIMFIYIMLWIAINSIKDSFES